MHRLFIFFIKVYQYTISPILGRSCRFYPTCSSYALESFEKHGTIYGFKLTTKRIFRCHPFSKGGFDPVPEKIKDKKN